MRKIYTFGYAGRTIDEIKKQIGDGASLDIRLSPRSRRPEYSKKRLLEAFPDTYLWVYEFGNENYKTGGDIKLYDPEVGLSIIHDIRAESDIDLYLMCQCQDYEKCHRKYVAELLRQRGYKVSEVKWTK